MDVRKSLSIAFLAISDQYKTFFFEFFYKMSTGVHFGCTKFTFDRISGHFRSICNFNFCLKFFTKWLTWSISDVRNSLWIAFLAISDRSAILHFRNSLSIEIHFRSKFTFDRNSLSIEIHFRSKFTFDRNSLSMAILAISDQYRIL